MAQFHVGTTLALVDPLGVLPEDRVELISGGDGAPFDQTITD